MTHPQGPYYQQKTTTKQLSEIARFLGGLNCREVYGESNHPEIDDSFLQNIVSAA